VPDFLLLPGRAALAGGDAVGRLRFVKCRAFIVADARRQLNTDGAALCPTEPGAAILPILPPAELLRNWALL